jgi:hypothetical protein
MTANRPLSVAFFLILIAAAHGLRLRGLEMNPDEVWTIWQTFGTPAQIIEWTPYDWTPLYYLMLGGWRILTGIHPITLHWLSVLLSLIGAAFAYRAGRQIRGYGAGILSMMIYAAIAYSVFLSGYVRPYALAHALIPAAFSLAIDYFDRPTFRRAIVLIGALALAFYTTLVIPVAAVFIGLYTLIAYPLVRAIRLWIPITASFLLLSLPILVTRINLVVTRGRPAELPTFEQAMLNLLGDYTGDMGWAWAALLVLAILALIFRPSSKSSRIAAGLALWGFGALVILYFLNPVLGFFTPSYAFWVITGMAMFGGFALSRLSKTVTMILTPILVVLMFIPVPSRIAVNYAPPGVSVFTWLRDHVQHGDVILLDEGFNCLAPYELDYYVRAFFPNGLRFVEAPEGHNRVWYASNVDEIDNTMYLRVGTNRIAGRFVGPPDCLWRLYEAPPDSFGILFDNGMRFHGATLIENGFPVTMHAVRREGETLTIRLWWTVDEPLTADYSVGVFILDRGGNLIAQSDSPPQAIEAPSETSQWDDRVLYVEERTLTLPPAPLDSGDDYRIALAVYQWWDGVRIPAEGVDEALLLDLMPLSVKSW